MKKVAALAVGALLISSAALAQTMSAGGPALMTNVPS